MTAAVATGLWLLAILDGASSGFRASVGRTGLIDHRADDRLAARRGVGLVVLLLCPVAAMIGVDAFRRHQLIGYTRAGQHMLTIYLPYAVFVLCALGVYAAMNWRLRYLASAVILGPLTLGRPAIAAAGAAYAATTAPGITGKLATILAAAAVLTVEPLAGRLWYTR